MHLPCTLNSTRCQRRDHYELRVQVLAVSYFVYGQFPLGDAFTRACLTSQLLLCFCFASILLCFAFASILLCFYFCFAFASHLLSAFHTRDWLFTCRPTLWFVKDTCSIHLSESFIYCTDGWHASIDLYMKLSHAGERYAGSIPSIKQESRMFQHVSSQLQHWTHLDVLHAPMKHR